MRRDFALPGTRARYAPDRICDVQHIKLALDVDVADKSIRGTCSLTLVPLTSDLGWLSLDAVELDIASVSCPSGKLPFSHDGKVLRINLQGAQTDSREIVVVIAYSGSPRRGLYFVGPDEAYPDKPIQVWSQGQDEDSRFWFPCFDSPHEKATSELIVTVPAEFFALSNGNLVFDDTTGDRRTLHWRFDMPHSCYLITLAAGEFSEIRDSWGDVAVTYYVTPGREDEARRTLGRTPEMIELFSRLFRVPYPYDKYAQVFVTDFIFGGMENTTATTITDTVLLDQRAVIDHEVEGLVAHELAHQWFGDLLTCRDWSEGWLNEGFATYSEYLWREHADGRDAADVELASWAEAYFGEDAERYRRKVATKLYDMPIDIFDHHLYDKGARVLHMLRQVLGDEAFWSAIYHYLTKHRTGSVETRDLTRAIEHATGRVLDWFFDQWITESAGHPELEVSYAWDADRRLARFTVTQTQKLDDGTPLFRLPLQVRFRIGGQDHDLGLEVTEAVETFFFALDEEPSQAIFDPGKGLLAKIKTDKGIQLFAAELAGATYAIDRAHAAQELAKRGGRRATDALIAALESDEMWAVRSAAAKALGILGTERARDALIRLAREIEHPKARRAVVSALGSFKNDPRAQEAVAEIVKRGDPSYFVEAEACLALGKTRSPRAPELLRDAAGRDSFADIIRQHSYRGLAEARDYTAIPFLCEATTYGRVSHGRRAALKALAELVQGQRDRDARDVRDLAEQLLYDRDYRVRLTAVEALGKISDSASIPVLQKMIECDLDGRLRRRARELIRDIREDQHQSQAIRSLRDELGELRTHIVALRERLDALDAAGDTAGKSKKRRKKQKKAKKPKKHKKSKSSAD